MRYYLIILIFFFILFDNILAQTNNSINHLEIEISDSISNECSINFINLGGQFLGAAVSGTIFSFPLYYFHPIIGGIGWLVGSSFGVYLIGNIGQQNSSYWGTLLGGVVGSTLFIVSFSNSKNIDSYDLYFGAILISIPFEILSYYIFKSDNKNSVKHINSQTKFLTNYNNTNRVITKPDISITLISINF